MTFTLPPYLWPPQKYGIEKTIKALGRGEDVCLQAPCGGGKTRMAIVLLDWILSKGGRGAFYTNRKLLIAQTAECFKEAKLPFGVRAADFEDMYDFSAPIQLCSTPTEHSRVTKRNIWQPFSCDLVIVDEAHIQKGKMLEDILAGHRERGAQVVLLTATPIGLSSMVDELVVSGTLQEFRDCQAIVPAVVRSIEQPDLRKVQRNAVGEYILDGEKKRLYAQTIVGNVIDRWKRYNPDARPTMLYAPGKPESVWFTEQFEKAGVAWAHIDATEAVLDGKRYKLTRCLWAEIQEKYKDGSIKGLSSRFKLREGLDMPATYHCILATPIGSLQSYIQTVGRVLRFSPETPDQVLVTDHGGNYLSQGSPNRDRPWQDWWDLPESVVSRMHLSQIKEQKATEPIRCPACEGERTGGFTCPHCGHQHQKSVRKVIMEDGRMVERDGKLIRPRHREEKPDTQAIWKGLVLGHLRKRKAGRGTDRTFAQQEAWFYKENGYYPPRTLQYMPRQESDFHRKITNVAREDLR